MENTNIGQEIYGLEKRYWQAMKDNDTKTILSLTDDPCIVTGPQGILKLSKKDFTAMMNAPQNYRLRNFEFDNGYEVSILNDDTAVIAYKLRESVEVEGEFLKLNLAESSTWRRRDGRWVCSLHTETIAGDPFGRDRIHKT